MAARVHLARVPALVVGVDLFLRGAQTCPSLVAATGSEPRPMGHGGVAGCRCHTGAYSCPDMAVLHTADRVPLVELAPSHATVYGV